MLGDVVEIALIPVKHEDQRSLFYRLSDPRAVIPVRSLTVALLRWAHRCSNATSS
jgi:hypothetical protein